MARSSKKALIVIDHGSRIDRANELIEQVAERLRARNEFSIVAAAHMELAEPTLAETFRNCVAAGAEEIVIVPYFLAGGSHVSNDIPQLAREAAGRHEGIKWRVTEPLGLDDRIIDVVIERAKE